MGSRELDEPREDLPVAAAPPADASGGLVIAALERTLALRPRARIELPEHRRAAVLVPLLVRDGEARLLFTRRSDELRAHGGQVSFPGGGCDDADANPEATAIREAREEIGIDPACVTVLGMLGDLATPTGFVITPVVAYLAPPPVAYRPNPAEVADVFEVSLAALSRPGVREVLREVERWGRRVPILSYKVDGRDIWGATAHMVDELLVVLGRRP